MVNKAIDEPMHQKIQKMSLLVKDEVFPGQSLMYEKKLITLNDYMLRKLGRIKNVSATCYQVDWENFY